MKFNISRVVCAISCSVCSVMSFSVTHATNLTNPSNTSNTSNTSNLPKCDANNIDDILAKGGCDLKDGGKVEYKLGVYCSDLKRGDKSEDCSIKTHDKYQHGYKIYPTGDDSDYFVIDDKSEPKVGTDIFNFSCDSGFEAHKQDPGLLGGSLKCGRFSVPKCTVNSGTSNPACSDGMKVYATCNHQFRGTYYRHQDIWIQDSMPWLMECSSAGVVTFNYRHPLIVDGSKQGPRPIDGFSSIYCEGDNASWVKSKDTKGKIYYECSNHTDLSTKRGIYGSLLSS